MRNLSDKITKLLLFSLIAFSLCIFFQYVPVGKEHNRERINTIFQEIQKSDLKKDVALKIIEFLPRGFYVYFDDENRLYVSAPREFLQGHWVLRVCFKGDIVSGKSIGTGDDIDITPNEAPAAVGICK